MADPASRYYVPLRGSERTPVPGAQVVGPVDPAEIIEVTIQLRPRADAGTLEAQADALGALPPEQRTYMAPEEYAATFGADLADMEKVVAFAREYGLEVVRTDLGQRTVVASGPARAMAAAFRVELVQYTSPLGAYRGYTGPISIPAELAGIVEGVFGLDTRRQAQPRS